MINIKRTLRKDSKIYNHMRFAISFDFWNTLYGTGDEPLRHKLRVAFFQKQLSAYVQTDIASLEKTFEWSRQHFLHNWIEKHTTPSTEERIRMMAKRLGVELSADETQTIAAYFGRLIHQVPPQCLDNLKDCIVELSTHYPLAIISDTGYITGKHIRRFLEEEHLLPYFTSFVFSDEHDYCKPHPSVFRRTCQNLQIKCSQLIHIGDLEHTDVKGIRACGGISIKYTGASANDREKSEADHIIKDYTMLPALIGTLTSC